ncbi:MAG: deoxyribodipyrimidine photo-lyase [Pseudomonadota bacterium]
MSTPPTIVWFRRDLRIADNAALTAAAGGPVLPVFILDPVIDAELGAAARLRLRMSLAALGDALRTTGLPLILRRGDALTVLNDLIKETGAARVTWNRLADGRSLARDKTIKAALKEQGTTVDSFDGYTLLNPWQVKTGAGGAFKVFTPFSRAVMAEDIPAPLPRPDKLSPFASLPDSDDLDDWQMDAPMGPAAAALAGQIEAGEDAALARLEDWLDGPAPRYGTDRDRLDRPDAGTRLSEYLALGEISPRMVWAIMDRAEGDTGVEAARRQLIWRDFAHMLLFNDAEMETICWRREWEEFPWRGDNEDAEAWRRGETGCDIVDAAMREVYVTGRMHNRARMLVGSYLTKHLLTDWRIGEAWFRETLIDWDAANNAMGWQWIAGCGPDAAPFFRIFNPERQAEKFDPDARYRTYWLSGEGAETFTAMRPKSHLTSRNNRPAPIVDLASGRNRALEAWQKMRDKG